MINHHPHDDLLLGLTAGSLDSGPYLVVASHVEGCAHCQARLQTMEVIGGAMLEELEPAVMHPEALATTLAAIDGGEGSAAQARPTAIAQARTAVDPARPDLPEGVSWPRSMKGCSVTRWRWLGPGMRWSRVTLPHDRSANVFLLRIGAGKKLPVHTHSDCELTHVLYGTFDDGRAVFGPGDFDEADTEILHQPVVQAGCECICLAAVSGRVLFQGAVARFFGSMVGM
ncbi:cadmium/peroxide/UV radiation responsive anti-sigma factor ChrR [soil metagenome]